MSSGLVARLYIEIGVPEGHWSMSKGMQTSTGSLLEEKVNGSRNSLLGWLQNYHPYYLFYGI